MTGAYRAEADALDAEILSVIERRHVDSFNDLALRIFAHQLRFNEPYTRYCASLDITLDAMPDSWERIPPVPAVAFKEAVLCTFDPARAELAFRTSGTTAGAGGVHYMENTGLYDAALLASFYDRFLRHARRPLRYLLAVPNPAENPHSSLGHMMKRVAETYGDGQPKWYTERDAITIDRFVHDVHGLQATQTPVFLAATAFALVQLLDALRARDTQRFELPAGSFIMETGGFKGRTRSLDRSELYDALERMFGVVQELIVSEYGMTELSSQYYDGPLVTRANGALLGVVRQSHDDIRQTHDDNWDLRDDVRVKVAPPWLRSYAVDEDGMKLPSRVVGALVHVDLANRSSCVAIQTEDLGAVVEGGIVLIGREHAAELRGCSLDAESLRVAVP